MPEVCESMMYFIILSLLDSVECAGSSQTLYFRHMASISYGNFVQAGNSLFITFSYLKLKSNVHTPEMLIIIPHCTVKPKLIVSKLEVCLKSGQTVY